MLRIITLILILPVIGYSQVHYTRTKYPETLSLKCPDGTENITPLNSAFEHEVVVLLNAERKNQGKPPLKKVDQLFKSSIYHAKDMSDNSYFSHDSQNGNGKVVCSLGDRVAPFYNWIAVSENIAHLQQTPTEVTQSWINSPGHYANMLADNVWEVGVGFYHNGTANTYWVENFGRRIDKFPIVINGEEISTTSETVELYIYGAGVYNEMRLRNDGGAWSSWQPFKSTVSNWKIRPEKGVRTVYVELRGGPQVLPSTGYQDEIEYNGIEPKVNDAGIVNIIVPGDIPNCNSTFTPAVRIKNFGNVKLTSTDIQYKNDNGLISTFKWTGALNPGEGVRANLNPVTTTSGNHNFSVWVSNPNGKPDGDNSNDTLNKSFKIDPVPSINIIQIVDPVCRKDSTGIAEVKGSDTNGPYDYKWNTNPVQTTAKATGLSAGDYEVIVTDIDGCSAQKKIAISEPKPYAGGFNLTHNQCKGAADGSIAPFVKSGGTPPYTFAYSTGDTVFSVPQGDTSRMITGLYAGNYTLDVIDSLGCITRYNFPIKNPKDSLSITVSSTPLSCAGCKDATATVRIHGSNGPTNIEWVGFGSNDTILTQLDVGTYIVEVTDSLGCMISDSIKVQPLTGISKPEMSTVQLFPNPSQGLFEVIFPSQDKYQLEMYNSYGQLVLTKNLFGKNTVDASELPNGMYVIVINYLGDIYIGNIIIE